MRDEQWARLATAAHDAESWVDVVERLLDAYEHHRDSHHRFGQEGCCVSEQQELQQEVAR
jgi:hypothetical protein